LHLKNETKFKEINVKTNYILRKNNEVTQTLRDNKDRVAMHDLIKYILTCAVHDQDKLKGLVVYKQEVDSNGEEVWCEPFMQFCSPEIVKFLSVFNDWNKIESPPEIVYENARSN